MDLVVSWTPLTALVTLPSSIVNRAEDAFGLCGLQVQVQVANSKRPVVVDLATWQEQHRSPLQLALLNCKPWRSTDPPLGSSPKLATAVWAQNPTAWGVYDKLVVDTEQAAKK
jgi:hypothetical protein